MNECKMLNSLNIGVGTGGGGLGVQEEVDRSTPSTGLMRDVPGGSALSS